MEAAKEGPVVMGAAIDDLIDLIKGLTYLKRKQSAEGEEVLVYWKSTMLPVLMAYTQSQIQSVASPEQTDAIKVELMSMIVSGFQGRIDSKLNAHFKARMKVNQSGQGVLPLDFVDVPHILRLTSGEIRSSLNEVTDVAATPATKKVKNAGTKRAASNESKEKKAEKGKGGSELGHGGGGITDESGKSSSAAAAAAAAASSASAGTSGGVGPGLSAKAAISPASTATAQPSTLPTKRSQENKYASNDEIAGVITRANFALGEIVYDKNECKKGKITDIEAIYRVKILVPQYTIQMCKGSSTTEFVMNFKKSYEENLTATVIKIKK